MSNSSKVAPRRFAEVVPATFDGPEQLPGSADEAAQWRMANHAFWEASPMRYNRKEEIRYEVGTRLHRGTKTDLFPLPSGRFKTTLMRILPDPVARS